MTEKSIDRAVPKGPDRGHAHREDATNAITVHAPRRVAAKTRNLISSCTPSTIRLPEVPPTLSGQLSTDELPRISGQRQSPARFGDSSSNRRGYLFLEMIEKPETCRGR